MSVFVSLSLFQGVSACQKKGCVDLGDKYNEYQPGRMAIFTMASSDIKVRREHYYYYYYEGKPRGLDTM